MGIFSRKTQAVDHDAASSLATAGWEAGKGAAWGAAAITLVGVVAGVMVLPWLLGASLGAAAIIGGIAGLVTSVAYAPVTGVLALGGGLFGLAKGGSKVSRENAEFRRQAAGRSQGNQHQLLGRLNQERMAGGQEVFPVAFNDGRAYGRAEVIQQLQMASAEQGNASGAVAMASAEATAKCACGPHSEAYLQEKAAAAAVATERK